MVITKANEQFEEKDEVETLKNEPEVKIERENLKVKKKYMQGDWKTLKSGKGLYLRPYRNVTNSEQKLLIPNKALTDEELIRYSKSLNIPFFRGVFMKDKLPKHNWTNETGIVNLDYSSGGGTHWVCYKKLFNTVYYFKSFGNLPLPQELQQYF